MDISVSIANEGDALNFKQLRLAALRKHPAYFSADLSLAEQRSDDVWREQLRQNDGSRRALFFARRSDQLIGMMGIAPEQSSKTEHRSMLWGVYVDENCRRFGVASKLLDACIDWANNHRILQIELVVLEENHAAISLYERYGFQRSGIIHRGIRVNDIFYNELMMTKALG